MAGALRLTEQFINMYDGDFNLMTYDYIPPVDIKTEPYIPETAHGPYIQIIEEPKQRGFRFRYECEGPSHGGLPGASSEKNRRTFPTVKIGNYVGPARVEVELVTHTDPPRVHAHSLVGRNCTESGTCSMDLGPNDLTASFSNLGILHVTKKSVVEVLTRRLREERRRHTHTHLTDAEETLMLKEAKDLGKVMDLNIVRLKFTAFLQDSSGSFSRALKPVVSNPIYDSKSPNASNLKISRMDKTCGSVLGGDEVFLLCDKVQKDDIEIRFYEEDDEGSWEAFGDFSPTDVHKQYAIVFKTPAYHSTDIERPVTVFLQLRRKKARDSSDPKQFTYVPQIQDKEEVLRKKQKPLPPYEPWRGAGGGARGQGGGATGGFPFQQMNGSAFFRGFSGFGDGGGAQMSEGQTNALLQIAAALQTQRSQSARATAEALLCYCRTGDVEELLNLQRNLCGVQDDNGDTPLHLAIIHQQTSVTNQLINILLSSNQSAVLNCTNLLQQTPLHLAVIGRQMKVVEVLLRGGVDPSLQDQHGHAPLHLAALSGDHAMLRLLLSYLGGSHAYLLNTPDFKGLRPLHLAVRRDGERCLRLLVGGGANVNAPELSCGNTALMMAVRDDLFKVACTLITELKADVNACNYSGNAPLHLAANQGSPTLCSMLIAAGADKCVENDEPLFSSSSDEEDEPMTDKGEGLDAVSQPISCRKRAGGHTPLDLAKCQKVRKLLSSSQTRHSKIRKSHCPAAGSAPSALDEPTLSRLQSVLSVGGVSWRTLADKLGMMTLTHLYQESSAPCQQLLHHYQLGGGAVEGLIEALQSLGVTEGVQLLRHKELDDDKHNTEATVDSGFSSQPMEEGEECVATNQ